jgi:hypothetical protein
LAGAGATALAGADGVVVLAGAAGVELLAVTGVAVAAGVVFAVAVPVDSLELLLAPQPLSAEIISKIVSGANAEIALDLSAMATLVPKFVFHTERERLLLRVHECGVLPRPETPLSVTHRPEALRHRLAPGMPLNVQQLIMQNAIRHRVGPDRQCSKIDH